MRQHRAFLRSAHGVASVMILALSFMFSPVATHIAQADDLDQTISPDQQHCTGRTVIDRGHLDFGPNLSSGQWKLELHDDTGDVSCWRDLSNTIIRVNDHAQIPMPDDERYSFVNEKPGTPLWVIPQTQNTKVVWLGWNTQEPTVIQQLSQGMNLSFEKLAGPGEIDLYLENGNLGAPQPIWSTQNPGKSTWIEVNAHTHTNWIFHKPGAYRLKITASGKLTNGKQISDSQELLFAVSNQVDVNTAFPASQDKTLNSGDSSTSSNQDTVKKSDSKNEESSANNEASNSAKQSATTSAANSTNKQEAHEKSILLASIAGGIALLVLVIALIVIAKARAAKREALRELH